MADVTVVRKRGEGKALWMLGGLYEVKVAADESGGALTIMEMTIPPGMGPPPHTHPGGEAVYVLEGAAYYSIAGVKHEGGPGTLFYIPAGTVENFEPAGDAPLRVLVTYTPGGVDRFFEEAGEPAKERVIPPAPTGSPDVERLATVGARYGMEIIAH